VIHPVLDPLLVTKPPNWFVVYFLLRWGRVVYIGTTTGIPWERIRSHRLDPVKNFNKTVYFLRCEDVATMRAEERKWIGLLRPVHNKKFNPSYNPKHLAWGWNASERRMGVEAWKVSSD